MKKIILCADDYGQNQPISQAIIALLEKKRLSATSCMTTAPLWLNHAQWLHPFKDQIDIGLHFNLTEGMPLSEELKASHGFLSLQRLLFKAYSRQLKRRIIEAELNAQLDAFVVGIGKLPDFIDGHQHIHQLPVIRDALLTVYEKRLRSSHCYVRCVHNPSVYWRLQLKGLVIQLLGAGTFKKKLVKRQIPHNPSFAGVYSFPDAKHYAGYFSRFLAQSKDRGIIMCHPGLQQVAETKDVIAKSRVDEFSYLMGDDFVLDCFQAGIELCSGHKTV